MCNMEKLKMAEKEFLWMVSLSWEEWWKMELTELSVFPWEEDAM